jgi:hypothetical protein
MALSVCVCACVRMCVHKPHFVNAACSFISSEMLGSYFIYYKNSVLGFKHLHYIAHSLHFISPILTLETITIYQSNVVFSGKTE